MGERPSDIDSEATGDFEPAQPERGVFHLPQDRRTEFGGYGGGDWPLRPGGTHRGVALVQHVGAGGCRGAPIQERNPELKGKNFQDTSHRIEVETNGTFQPRQPLAEIVDQWNVSPKLAHSGNDPADREIAAALAWFAFAAQPNAYFKFVVAEPEDVEEVGVLAVRYGLPAERVYLGRAARIARIGMTGVHLARVRSAVDAPSGPEPDAPTRSPDTPPPQTGSRWPRRQAASSAARLGGIMTGK
ncbi:MAG TPA: hypothetical protein VFN74_07800 [Chloroflexota bacterium]|nr:hypothetical protein [Chloroflexota bacterium]